MAWVIILIVVAIALGGFLVGLNEEKDRETTMLDAYKEYKEALEGDSRVIALEKGRKYFSSARKNGKVTVMDETQMMNDINAHLNLK